jgi:ATP-dependent DNA helicase RecG
MPPSKGDLEKWVQDGEGESLEFKTSSSSGCRTASGKTTAAFLNTHGGRVVFGIDPEGKIVGQTVSDKSLRDISATLSEVEPPAYPSIEKVDVGDGKFAIVVTVERGQYRPYSFKGKPYRRVGSTTIEMDQGAHNAMLVERLHGTQRWENASAEGWTIDDLDTDEIALTVEEAIRSGRMEDPVSREPSDLLRGLGLLKGDQTLRAAGSYLGGRTESFPTSLNVWFA